MRRVDKKERERQNKRADRQRDASSGREKEMELYLVRHGQTEWNRLGRLQGRSDIPLNEAGREAARETGEKLANINFSVIYSSPLKRAAETAELIRGNRKIPLRTDDRLLEMAFGVWEGCQMRGMETKEDGEMVRRFFEEPEAYVPPRGGESFEELCRRTDSFLNELRQKEKPDAAVLIVAHGALLKGLQLHPLGRPLKEYWSGGVQKNCSVTVLEEKDGTYRLLRDAE